MNQQPGFNRFNPSSISPIIFRTPKLIWALIKDGRVRFRYKLLPIGAVLYAILPDFIPGGFDDLLLNILGPMFFLRLCRDRHPRVYEELYDTIFPERAAVEKGTEEIETEEKGEEGGEPS